MLGVIKCADYYNQSADGETNTDGNTKLLSRSARASDITVNTELDMSSFGAKFVITPNNDIKNLSLKVRLLDSDKSVLYTTTKSLGNVTEGVQVSFTISIFELSLSIVWNTSYTSWQVAGGTVSYFS